MQWGWVSAPSWRCQDWGPHRGPEANFTNDWNSSIQTCAARCTRASFGHRRTLQWLFSEHHQHFFARASQGACAEMKHHHHAQNSTNQIWRKTWTHTTKYPRIPQPPQQCAVCSCWSPPQAPCKPDLTENQGRIQQLLETRSIMKHQDASWFFNIFEFWQKRSSVEDWKNLCISSVPGT